MADLQFKYTKKAVRDIYLSNDIGRESPFDPFKDRTVTKFMTKPSTFISDGMYFAEKARRRVPCMVNYNTVGHHANIVIDKLIEEGGIPATRKEDEALNAKGYTRPNYIRDVSFTKAPRFTREDNPIQQRKRLMEEREERLKQEKFRSSTRHDNVTVPDIVQQPDCSRAPTLAPTPFVPPPKEDNTLIMGKPKFTVFDFEKKKASLPRSESAPLEPARPTSLFGHEDGEDEGGEEDAEAAEARRQAEQLRLMTSAADAQEAWEAKRKATLAKHGMITGNRRELLRAKAIAKRADTAQGIADFSLLSSRDAPTAFQPSGKERNDLLYLPSYTATTRDVKRMADVRIDKYAKRAAKSSELKDSVDKILTIENLSRFYKKQTEQERHSTFITPDEQAMFSLANTSSAKRRPSSSLNKSGPLPEAIDPMGPIKPFSPFDDYALHPPTPPKGTQTRKFTKTPDLSNFADRANEPLAAILGGDRQQRERQARQALRREGLL